MKLKIVSDGTVNGTSVILPDGTAMPGVAGVSWYIDVDGASKCLLELVDVACETILDTKDTQRREVH
jgi:hypothetical protein